MATETSGRTLVQAMPEISRAIRMGRLADAIRLLREHMSDAAARRALAELISTEPTPVS